MWDSNIGDCNFRDNKMSTVFDTSHSLFWGSQDLGHETLNFLWLMDLRFISQARADQMGVCVSSMAVLSICYLF